MLTEAEGRESREWGMPGQKGAGGELVEVSRGFWPALSQLGFCQWALSRAWGKRATELEVLNESTAETAEHL